MGDVEINFKSDYLPLDKMADSFQIGRIQDASKPGKNKPGAPAPGGTPAAAAPPAGGATTAPKA